MLSTYHPPCPKPLKTALFAFCVKFDTFYPPMTNDEYKAWQQGKGKPRAGIKGFYDSRAWRQMRKAKLTADPICELRIKCPGYPATTVDHWIPARVDTTKLLDWNNLRSACRACNSAKAHEDLKHYPMRYDKPVTR